MPKERGGIAIRDYFTKKLIDGVAARYSNYEETMWRRVVPDKTLSRGLLTL